MLDYIPADTLDFVFDMDLDYFSDDFEMQRNNKDLSYNQFGKTLVDLCCTHSIHIVNGRLYDDTQGEFTCLTRNGASVVDYHITSSECFRSIITRFSILTRDESDHLPVYVCLTFPCYNNPTETDRTLNGCNSTDVSFIEKFKWKEQHKQHFLDIFTDTYELAKNEILQSVGTNINDAIDKLVNIYKHAAAIMKVGRNGTPHLSQQINQPWWDAECDVAKQAKYSSLRRFRSTNSNDDLQVYFDKRKLFKNICNEKRLSYQKNMRQSLIQSRTNPNKFWQIIKRNRSHKNVSQPEIDQGKWIDYFKELLFKPNLPRLEELEIDDRSNPAYDQILNRPFTDDEISASIRKLKTGKSQGLDGIGAEFYKHTCHIICPMLRDIFNTILNTGVFPNCWRDSVIVPIHKSGSKLDPANYRGISLINVMYKIFSNIVYTRLNDWAEGYGKIDESQAGFRAEYSTTDNMFTLTSLIQKYISKPGGRFYVLYVDFQRAFDGLLHHKLFENLQNIGCKGKLLKILIAMYSNLQSCVRISSHSVTQSFKCNIGTRQGDVSSTIMFNLFINELPLFLRRQGHRGIFVTHQIQDIICILFADDVANCTETASELQRQLNSISEFCHNMGMAINQKKTEIIVFRNGGPLRAYEKWKYRDNVVNVTSVYKYMGLLYTPKLSWTKAKLKLAAQARKSVGAIKSFQSTYGYFQLEEYFKLFDSMVKPILLYASEIWGSQFADVIENVQVQYCKSFLGVGPTVNDCMALGECGRLPLCTEYYLKIIKYWCKLLQMAPNRYPRNCYLMLKQHDDIGRVNWATSVKNLLYRYGFGYAWIYQDIGNVNLFLTIFKQRIIDCMLQNWSEKVNDSPRCDTYKHFKSLLEPEKYLSTELPFCFRKALAKFRCSNHKFAIELGRHEGIIRENRICLYCQIQVNRNVIEMNFMYFSNASNLLDNVICIYILGMLVIEHLKTFIDLCKPEMSRKLENCLSIFIR